jgi:2-C-methyl-D-erythritol 2,4-cyclodiphosphate synthase
MIRVGLGADAHAFAADRPLVLGGVRVRELKGLAGHSDADVLAHAIGDALLGAAALGELGQMFPDEVKWKDASSLEILRDAYRAVTGAGWTAVNIDSTVVAQEPKLAPHLDEMRKNLAETLDIDVDAVSVKAKTTDHLGFTGRGEGIAALAVALIERS